MIVTMSCIHLLYMYLIGARKQDVVYAAVLDAIDYYYNSAGWLFGI